MNTEQGRQLRVDELKIDTIVILIGNHTPTIGLTVWIRRITDTYIHFFAGQFTPSINLLLFRTEDPMILGDDAGHRIKAFKYLGKL